MAEVKNEEAMANVESTELKKTSSNRYWARSSTMTASKATPRPLTADEMHNGKTLGSKWNQAGTWEENVLSSWAYSRVKELLPTVEPVEFDHGCIARILEVTSCSGDASMVTVRQRKRVAYSFEIEMKYVVNMDASNKAIEGKMKVPEACYGELDELELEVTVSAGDVKDSARVKQTLTKLFLPKIRRKLEEFEAELKEREHAAALEGLARLSTDVFSEKPFEGLVICVTGLSKEARKQVQMMTERMGGQYSPDLHVNCTHLVVQSCSGRKFEHALKHGLHRGLYVVTLPWFLNSAKQFERLDEDLYSVQKSIPDAFSPENFSDAIASSSWQNSCISANCDMGTAYRQNNSVLKARSSGGSIKTSASTPRTPHSTRTIQTSNTNTALSGARFYIDPDLSEDLQAKVLEAVDSWGATCVEIWSKNNNTTHVVCDPNSLSKYIGLNLHLVSPMWVLSARDGFPLRCVQYSADLARNVADLLLSGKDSGSLPKGSVSSYGRPANARTADAHLQDRQEKANAAKAGVRRRRGPRMQPCRTLPRPITPTSLLDSICWVVTDTPSAAEVYTDSSGKVVLENGEAENGYEDDNGHYRELGNKVSDKELYTRVLSESEKREIVFRGAFLTILFPIDRFSELGPSSRTFFSEGGFCKEQIIELIHSFYQEFMSPDDIDAAIHTDSKHADRLRTVYTSNEVDELGYVPMLRAEFLGSRRQFEGLKRIGQEPTSHIYDLWLGS